MIRKKLTLNIIDNIDKIDNKIDNIILSPRKTIPLELLTAWPQTILCKMVCG